MASIINATTSTGLVSSADNSGSLQLATNNGTTAVTIDTSQNVTFAKPITVGGNTLGAGNASSFKNRIINGAMVIDQRNAGASVTPTANAYTLDRWQATLTQASKFSVQQDASAVTPPTGFNDYLGITSTSAYSVVSSDVFTIRQSIEGFNTSDLDFGKSTAKTITLSFWVRSSLTGTFGGALKNSAADRSYPFTYTISSANTWEQKSITIAGDTTGTWLVTNGIGLIVSFGLGVGSTFNGTAGAWAAGNFNSATGATSVVGTNGATWYITGVQLEVGSTATSFDYRPYGTELALCQRYLPALNGINFSLFGYTYSTNNNIVSFPLQVQSRVSPTGITTSAMSTFTSYNGSNSFQQPNSITLNLANTSNCNLLIAQASGFTAGQASRLEASGVNAQILFTGCEL